MKETKERIILKALQYFVKNDYQSVSLNSIADSIGITKGGIYHYFDSKDDLFMECMITVFNLVGEFSAGMVNEDAGPKEVLESLFSFENIFQVLSETLKMDFISNYMEYTYLLFVGMKKFPQISEMISSIYSEMQKSLESLFFYWQTNGVIKKEIDCRLITFEIIAQIEGAMLVSGFTAGTDLSEVGKDLVESTLKRISV